MSDGDDAWHHIETAVLAAISAIPVVGGPLSVIIERTVEHSRENVAETGRAALEEAGDPQLLLTRVESDERMAYLLLNAAEGAARTSLAAKRRLLGRVVGRAAKDPARIDESELMASALRDLDAPHIRALAQVGEALNKQKKTQRLVVVQEVMSRYPAPIAAALRRHGLVTEVSSYDYAGLFDGLTDFGTALLQDLRRADLEDHP